MTKIFRNKVTTVIMMAVLTATLVISGCSPSTGRTVTIAGSTSVQLIAEELGMAFMSKNPGVRVEVSGGGSGAGIKAAQTKTADIGMASRALKAEETGINAILIAIDGIAVVVNPRNETITNLTMTQIKDIFSGKVTNWKDVGGSDSEIIVVNREEGSGTRGAFQDIVLGEDRPTEKAIIQNSTGAVREAVKQDVNAIGYVSMGGLNPDVKAINVNGVEATIANVKAKKFPVVRPFNFLVHDSQALSEQGQAFIDFVLSAEGQKVVEDNKLITIN